MKTSVEGAASVPVGTLPPATSTGGPAGQLQPPPSVADQRDCKKPGLAKILKGVASSSISGKKYYRFLYDFDIFDN